MFQNVGCGKWHQNFSPPVFEHIFDNVSDLFYPSSGHSLTWDFITYVWSPTPSIENKTNFLKLKGIYLDFRSWGSFLCRQSFPRWASWWSWGGWRGRAQWRWGRAGCPGSWWRSPRGTCWPPRWCGWCSSGSGIRQSPCPPPLSPLSSHPPRRYWCCSSGGWGRTKGELIKFHSHFKSKIFSK